MPGMGSSLVPSQPLTQFSFSLFTKLPPEIQLEILSHSQQNDLICLSLASHSVRALTLPLIPAKPLLSSYDQTRSPEELECTCGNKKITAVFQESVSRRRHLHVYKCEKPNGTVSLFGTQECRNGSLCRKYPPEHACRRPWCKHCQCTTCPLYTRLRGWMGDRKYCTKCRKFTTRPKTKTYKGRCLHGRPPVRRDPNNHWTAKKGQSYGYRWWRRWGTCTVTEWGYPNGDKTADISWRRNTRVV